jgi:hypothetical protein
MPEFPCHIDPSKRPEKPSIFASSPTRVESWLKSVVPQRSDDVARRFSFSYVLDVYDNGTQVFEFS